MFGYSFAIYSEKIGVVVAGSVRSEAKLYIVVDE